MADIECGAQEGAPVQSFSDWTTWKVISALAGAVGAGFGISYIAGHGIPVINSIVNYFMIDNFVQALAASGAAGTAVVVGAAVGALAVLGLVFYYLTLPDGCVRGPGSNPTCLSGIVAQVTDISSSIPLIIFAPFAIGPAYTFDVVVKHRYGYLITNGAKYVICDDGIPILRCVVKDEHACAAKIGAAVGGVVGAVAGTALGIVAGAIALAALSCGPLAFLCAILAVIIAVVIAAATTYVGAAIGGEIGYGIGVAKDSTVRDTAASLSKGALVAVRGDLVKDPDAGFNEIFYVTKLIRNGAIITSIIPISMDSADIWATDDCGDQVRPD